MMPLSTQQKKYLRGLCHDLSPVVTIADKGLTDNVAHEIDLALSHHELVKIKIRQEKALRSTLSAQLAEDMAAEAVMSIGQMLCLYRPNLEKPAEKRITLPKR